MKPSKRGRIAEKSNAKRLGGKHNKSSGAYWNAKGDYSVGNYLVENKSSTNEYFSITSEIWNKANKEAIKARKTPALVIGFGKFDPIYKKHQYELAFIDYDLYLEQYGLCLSLDNYQKPKQKSVRVDKAFHYLLDTHGAIRVSCKDFDLAGMPFNSFI